MPTDAEIKKFVDDVLLRTDIDDVGKAEIIAQAAEQYGVSNQQISVATGYTIDQVTDYLATAESGSGFSNAVINDFITDVLDSNATIEEKKATIREAMVEYDVNYTRVAQATGLSYDEVRDLTSFTIVPAVQDPSFVAVAAKVLGDAPVVPPSAEVPAPVVRPPAVVPAPVVRPPAVVPAPVVRPPAVVPAPVVRPPAVVPAPVVRPPAVVPPQAQPVLTPPPTPSTPAIPTPMPVVPFPTSAPAAEGAGGAALPLLIAAAAALLLT